MHGPPDELSNKRAQFFAKTILNAKNVAEHFFEEEMDKYKINKDHDDKKKQLLKIMQLRGNRGN